MRTRVPSWFILLHDSYEHTDETRYHFNVQPCVRKLFVWVQTWWLSGALWQPLEMQPRKATRTVTREVSFTGHSSENLLCCLTTCLCTRLWFYCNVRPNDMTKCITSSNVIHCREAIDIRITAGLADVPWSYCESLLVIPQTWWPQSLMTVRIELCGHDSRKNSSCTELRRSYQDSALTLLQTYEQKPLKSTQKLSAIFYVLLTY